MERRCETGVYSCYIFLSLAAFLQHPDEKRYQFTSPCTMKPTQIKCSEGSINQIPEWAEIRGDIRLTPFYNMRDCMKKVEEELNDGD